MTASRPGPAKEPQAGGAGDQDRPAPPNPGGGIGQFTF